MAEIKRRRPAAWLLVADRYIAEIAEAERIAARALAGARTSRLSACSTPLSFGWLAALPAGLGFAAAPPQCLPEREEA